MGRPVAAILARLCLARLCLALLLLLGGGCGRERDSLVGVSPRVKIAALFDSRRHPFRNTQALMLQKYAQGRAGVELSMWDAAGSAALQSGQLTNALASKPDFLLVFPVDPSAVAAQWERSGADGTRVIVFGDLPAAGPRSTVIASSEPAVGKAAGEFVLGSLERKAAGEGQSAVAGRVVELTAGDDAALSGAFGAALAKQPGVILVHQAPCGLLGEDTAERVGEVLRLQKDFDVIFAHNDLIARAASKVLAAVQPELRERVLIVGADGTLGKGGGNEMILKGDIDATVGRPLLMDLAWAIITRCLSDTAFAPKARYELNPAAVGVEGALQLARDGRPVPPVE